jgi:hypothetical protein
VADAAVSAERAKYRYEPPSALLSVITLHAPASVLAAVLSITSHGWRIKLSVVVGDKVVGETVEGETDVGDSVVGETDVGESVVGESVTGDIVIGDAVVGDTDVGLAVVGETVVGDTVVGDLVVGDTVVGDMVVVIVVVRSQKSTKPSNATWPSASKDDTETCRSTPSWPK